MFVVKQSLCLPIALAYVLCDRDGPEKVFINDRRLLKLAIDLPITFSFFAAKILPEQT